jgi:transposase
VKVLRTLPGIGEFTALVLLAEIGDITRFPSARKLASWAGLTPTVRGSDLTVRHGHISKQGSAWLRWVLNQAAQTAKRSPEYAASYQAIAKSLFNNLMRPVAGSPESVPARSARARPGGGRFWRP